MRYVIGGLLFLMGTTGCPTSGTVTPADASADDATADPPPEGVDGGVMQPVTSGGCTDDAHCISGTAALDPLFAVGPGVLGGVCALPQCTTWQVDLFDTYPAGNVQPIGQPVLVAMDGTWSFDGVGTDGGAPGGYYVQASVALPLDGGQSVVSAIVGPLTVAAAGVAIDVAPLQATAYEARVTGGSMLLDWVQARLFDPSSGAEITSGAQVSVAVDGGSMALVPTAFGATTAYYAAFAQPPGAQSAYTVTATHPAFGDAGVAVQLVADPPTFDGGMITSVDAGTGGKLSVTWVAEPQAGYEVVEVYASHGDGGWAAQPAYGSPAPDPPGKTSEVTGPLEAGTYLVNVAYTRANCPADAGGCVQAATVAAATTTVP